MLAVFSRSEALEERHSLYVTGTSPKGSKMFFILIFSLSFLFLTSEVGFDLNKLTKRTRNEITLFVIPISNNFNMDL